MHHVKHNIHFTSQLNQYLYSTFLPTKHFMLALTSDSMVSPTTKNTGFENSNQFTYIKVFLEEEKENEEEEEEEEEEEDFFIQFYEIL